MQPNISIPLLYNLGNNITSAVNPPRLFGSKTIICHLNTNMFIRWSLLTARKLFSQLIVLIFKIKIVTTTESSIFFIQAKIALIFLLWFNFYLCESQLLNFNYYILYYVIHIWYITYTCNARLIKFLHIYIHGREEI